MARVSLRNFTPRPLSREDHERIAEAVQADARRLFGGGTEPEPETLTAAERHEALLRSGLEETRALPADEALRRVRATREAIRYAADPDTCMRRVALDAIEDATLSRRQREAVGAEDG